MVNKILVYTRAEPISYCYAVYASFLLNNFATIDALLHCVHFNSAIEYILMLRSICFISSTEIDYNNRLAPHTQKSGQRDEKKTEDLDEKLKSFKKKNKYREPKIYGWKIACYIVIVVMERIFWWRNQSTNDKRTKEKPRAENMNR